MVGKKQKKNSNGSIRGKPINPPSLNHPTAKAILSMCDQAQSPCYKLPYQFLILPVRD